MGTQPDNERRPHLPHEKGHEAVPLPPAERLVPFRLGRVLITPGALAELQSSDVLVALRRHAAKDWGDLCPDDRERNDQALLLGTRVLSAYQAQGGTKFWIITEADRSCTTVLLPEEY